MPLFPTAPREQLGTLEVSPDRRMSHNGAGGADQAKRAQIKNRRKRYLDLHPEYFKQSHLELAGRYIKISLTPFIVNDQHDIPTGPLLYDRLVRRFQSADEREKEGREKGYSGVLEANFVRSEARLEAMRHPDPNSPMTYTQAPDGAITAVEQDQADRAKTREEGWQQWTDFMASRFLSGEDADFEYEGVDQSEEYDDREEMDRRHLNEYLDGEEEKFLGTGKPSGETGVQDF